MAFGLGCFSCCAPCDPCDAACDETPDEAFAVVYQVEDQRANLTWTGDAMGPIDGPWPGFEGGTVFSQTITSNGIVLPGSRFPCYFRLKLWRNVGGGEGSETLASQRVTISCTEGKLDLGFVALNAGESVEFNPNPASASENATYVFPSTAIQLDENGGDRHAFPPAFGWIGGRALCAGTIVSVQAHIEWTNGLIQHNLYGEFVECFDGPGTECSYPCDPDIPTPGSLFLTITNTAIEFTSGFSGPSIDINGEYILSALPPVAFGCNEWGVVASATGATLRGWAGPSEPTPSGVVVLLDGIEGLLWGSFPVIRAGGSVRLLYRNELGFICDSSTEAGSATLVIYGDIPGISTYDQVASITFDWELST